MVIRVFTTPVPVFYVAIRNVLSLLFYYTCCMVTPINYPKGFSPESRTWIYQASRSLSTTEQTEIQETLDQFTANWQSHGEAVKGAAMVLPEGFIMLVADHTVCEVSGCSTDSSVRTIRELDARYQLDLFNRQVLAFLVNDAVVRIPLQELPCQVEKGAVQPDTLYFNNMVQTLSDLESGWLIPAEKSWLAKKFRTVANPVA